MITVIKTIISTVLLSVLLATSSDVEARLKYYRYNSNIPMVEMSLNMMVAMGVLEQIPGHLVHDGNPYHRLVNAQPGRYSHSSYALPVNTGYYNGLGYDTYRDGGISPYRSYYGTSPYSNYYGNSPYSNSPYSSYYGNNPYSSHYGNNPYSDYYGGSYGYADPNRSWGSPWGNQWNSPWNSAMGSPWNSAFGNQLNSPWSSPWGNRLNNPWGGNLNSPWISPWSNTMMNPSVSPLGGAGTWSGVPGYSNMPVLPGNVSDSLYGGNGASSFTGDSRSGNTPLRSDISSVEPYSLRKSVASGRPGRYSRPYQIAYDRANNKQDHRLNGLWIGDSGEMLGIRSDMFLWYDGKDKYASGKLLKTPTMMKAKVEGTNTVISMHYRLLGNELFTVSRSGKMRTFSRTPLMQPATVDSELYASPSIYNSDSTASSASKSKNRADITTALMPTPKHQSDSASAVSSYDSRRTGSTAALKPYWGEKSPMWSRNVSFTAGTSRKDVREVSSASGYDDTRGKRADDKAVQGAVSRSVVTPYADGVSDVWNSLPAEMPYRVESALPVNAPAQIKPQASQSPFVHSRESRRAALPSVPYSDDREDIWKPLTPYVTYPAVPDSTAMAKVYPPFTSTSDGGVVVPPGARAVNPLINGNQGETSASNRLDPNTYLYSYLKNPGGSRAAVRPSYPRDNANIWLPPATFRDNGYPTNGTTATNTQGSSNIWKTSNSFADRQRYQKAARSYYAAPDNSAESEKSANANVRKFIWSENGQWD